LFESLAVAGIQKVYVAQWRPAMKTWLCAAMLLGTILGICRADAIHLKDGTTITADKVAEKDGQVAYTVGGTQYSVPKSSVSGIEHGSTFGISVGTSKSGWIAAPADSGATHPASDASHPASGAGHKVSHSELAAALPREPKLRGVDSDALTSRVVSFSRVNERALQDIEAEGSPATSAAAYLIAARYAYDHSDGEAARKYMKRCIQFEPEQAGLLEWYSLLLLEGGQYQDAVTQAEHAARQDPNSADALQVLGLAEYDSGRFAEAIQNWKRAQELHPSEVVATYLAKAEREAKVEGNFSEREGAHFVLRYEGHQAAFRFPSQLLYALDRQYGELQRELGFAPDSTITVILYTEQQFFDVTQAPAWAGGLNDGKLRIPVRDLSEVTPQLESVLRHEMTHSFIHSLTHGRCPTWLNEGLAQMEEPRSSRAFAAPLARLFHDGRAVPLHYLEGSFTGFSAGQAQLAYGESLAATEYMRSAYGMYAVRRMLELLSDGEAPEAALSHAVRANYAEFESGLGSYLAKNAR
jgi:tetratricopeptide (TPR) repeat protein